MPIQQDNNPRPDLQQVVAELRAELEVVRKRVTILEAASLMANSHKEYKLRQRNLEREQAREEEGDSEDQEEWSMPYTGKRNIHEDVRIRPVKQASTSNQHRFVPIRPSKAPLRMTTPGESPHKTTPFSSDGHPASPRYEQIASILQTTSMMLRESPYLSYVARPLPDLSRPSPDQHRPRPDQDRRILDETTMGNQASDIISTITEMDDTVANTIITPTRQADKTLIEDESALISTRPLPNLDRPLPDQRQHKKDHLIKNDLPSKRINEINELLKNSVSKRLKKGPASKKQDSSNEKKKKGESSTEKQDASKVINEEASSEIKEEASTENQGSSKRTSKQQASKNMKKEVSTGKQDSSKHTNKETSKTSKLDSFKNTKKSN